MSKKLSLIFLFHVLCLGLLFVPDKYQGPIVLMVAGIDLRLLDVTAILLIILATIVLFIYVLKNLPRMEQLRELARAEESNPKKPGNDRK